jgi:hypothetical protein
MFGVSKLNSIAKFTAAAGRTALTVTAVGNAQVSTAQSKFGGASALFDGTGDYLTTSAHGSSSTTFTVEGWVRFTNVTTRSYAAFWQGDIGDSSERSQIYMSFSSAGAEANRLYIALGSSSTYSFLFFAQTWATNTWYHVAVSRDSSDNIRAFVNGTQIGTTQNNTRAFLHSARTGRIGTNSYFTGDMFAYVDDFRISTTARYTANFTAPTTAFTNDANTLLLIHADGTNGSTTFTDDNA